MTYPAMIYVWTHENDPEGHWRYLCLVSDAESHGLLERLIGPEHKLKANPYFPIKHKRVDGEAP